MSRRDFNTRAHFLKRMYENRTHRRVRPDRMHLPDGMLAASCWCEMLVVAVSAEDVWEGRTGSCGRPQCKPGEPA